MTMRVFTFLQEYFMQSIVYLYF